MPVFDSQTKKEICSPNNYGMLLCVAGSSSMLINGNKYQASRGTLCFFGPFSNIEILSKSEDCCWELISDANEVLYPVVLHVLDTIMKHKLFKDPCISLDESHIKTFIFYLDKIRSSQYELEDTYGKKRSMYRHHVVLLEQTAFLEYILLYFQEHTISTHKVSRSENIAYNFIVMLVNNFATQRSVEWYARQVKLAPGYFSKIVRQYTGYPPTEWIKNVTITNAKMLLSQPNITVKEVSNSLNFPEQFTFRKYFKQHTGMSPKQYQKSLMGEFEK